MDSFKELLSKYENVYLFEIDQGRVLFKLLPYKDYSVFKYIIKSYPSMKWDIEDEIWEQCVIEHTFGYGREYIHAGVVSTVANLILWYSCAKETNEANQILEKSRQSLQDAVQQAIIFICMAFPSYLPEDLEKQPWDKLMKRLAQAEVMLNKSFEFKAPDSQQVDDSGKIFQKLNEISENDIDDLVQARPVDFNKINAELHQEEYGNPTGDFNLRNIRG